METIILRLNEENIRKKETYSRKIKRKRSSDWTNKKQNQVVIKEKASGWNLRVY